MRNIIKLISFHIFPMDNFCHVFLSVLVVPVFVFQAFDLAHRIHPKTFQLIYGILFFRTWLHTPKSKIKINY
jgi:hypothetical protein